MLVRASSTKANLLGISFDEAQHRTTRYLEHEDWAEFLVTWRKNSGGEKWIELCDDYVCIAYIAITRLRQSLIDLAEYPIQGTVIETQAPCVCHSIDDLCLSTISILLRRPDILYHLPANFY
jgi:hypothetical protein